MSKLLTQRKTKLLAIILLLSTLTPISFTSTDRTPPVVKVFPSMLVVRKENELFTVTVAVANVVNLFAWQVTLYFDPNIVNSTNDMVSYSPWHIFSGKQFVAVDPVVQKSKDGAYVKFGASLQGEEPTFNGSGVLCQINFTGVSEGVSTLRFSRPLGEDTFLWNSNCKDISFMIVDARPSSKITINVEPTETTTGQYISIHGAVSPITADADVTIHYKISGGDWDILATVKTDTESYYSYFWKTKNEGTYEIRASWLGDENINPAISETKIVTVQAPINIIPYVAAGIIVIILVIMYHSTRKTHKSATKNTSQ